MKSNPAPAQKSKAFLSPNQKQDPHVMNGNFMDYVSRSQVNLDEQQKEEDYDEVMKALTSGVYQSSDVYRPDDELDQEQGYTSHQSQKYIPMDEQNRQKQKEALKQAEVHIQINEPVESKQIQGQVMMQSSPTLKESYQHIQNFQNKNVQTTEEDNKLQQEQQQFQFAQSMSHYESVMQFANPSLMEQSIRHEPQGQKLQQIEEQIDVNEQTNSVCIESNIYDSVRHELKSSIPSDSGKEAEKVDKQKIAENIVHKERSQISKPLSIEKEENQIKKELKKFTISQHYGKTYILITGYQKEYFLKMQTQIYQIDVHKGDRQYSIKRRFADFVALQEIVRLQYSGFILYPFPESSLEYFKKTKFSIGNPQQKIILIQKRLFQLQKYVNSLFSHSQISLSYVLQVFVQENYDVFQKQINKLQSISLSQEKDMHLGIMEKNYSSIKKLVRSNISFLKAYFPDQDIQTKLKLEEMKRRSNINSQRFVQIRNYYQTFNLKLESFSIKVRRLAVFYKESSQRANIESNIDSVLRFSSKLSSSCSFYAKIYEEIQDSILNDVVYYENLLRTIDSSLAYRAQLITKINSLQAQHYGIGSKLEQNIRLFDDRFFKDWRKLCEEFQENMAILFRKFNTIWKSHCALMSKVWK